MRTWSVLVVAVGITSASAVASADDPKAADKGKPIVVETVKIVGRNRPHVSVDVNRVPMSAALAPLRERFLSRIERPVGGDPF